MEEKVLELFLKSIFLFSTDTNKVSEVNDTALLVQLEPGPDF